MPYSDSNPERRNLIVLSLGIIIFYLADGYLIDKEIKFKLINIGFHDLEMLIKIVWVVLGWFIFRYIVTNKNSHGASLHNPKQIANLDYPFVRAYLNKQRPGKMHNPRKTAIYYDPSGVWIIQPSSGGEHLSGFDGYIIRTLYMMKILLRHRATSDYYTPYFLAILAILLGINSVSQDIDIFGIIIPIISIAIIEVLYLIR